MKRRDALATLACTPLALLPINAISAPIKNSSFAGRNAGGLYRGPNAGELCFGSHGDDNVIEDVLPGWASLKDEHFGAMRDLFKCHGYWLLHYQPVVHFYTFDAWHKLG
jgi:hypothetical protein